MSKHISPQGDPPSTGLAAQQRARETTLHDLARLRKQASTEIDRLIGFLDASDPYAMTELEDDDLEQVGDDEPSLGSFDRMLDQSKSYVAVQGEVICGTDAELDNSDAEPSLGSVGAHDQERWAIGDRSDRENGDDTGIIGDLDGLIEQTGGAQ